MKSSAVALGLLAALAACKPSVHGRCTKTSDCRAGSACDEKTNICIAASGTCNPACAAGQLCSGGVCSTVKPVVSVELDPSALLSPTFDQVKVNVVAGPDITLRSLSVEVDSDHEVASGSIATSANGDNVVHLTHFQSGAVGAVSVFATLQYGSNESVRSVAVAANIDDAPPSVTISVQIASDTVNGWVPRTAASVEVRALVDDGAGSGAQSATLTFDTCPASGDCSYQGATVGSPSNGVTTFSFEVPRMVQAAGSEALLSFKVTALDRAGNQGRSTGILRIDDAPPVIGTVAPVVAGTTGEDGNSWYVGGSGAADVEIAVPATDQGSGLASLTLLVNSLDVVNGTPLSPAPTPNSDGTIHFKLPASGVQGREGPLRFTLTANDVLHNQSTAQGSINVDALPPVVSQPHVDYAGAVPALADVCSSDTAVTCGRQVNTHLLADDTADVSFDIVDCGAGVAPAAQPDATAAGDSNTLPVSTTGSDASSCPNGNRVHHFQFTLALSSVALASADSSGTALVALTGNAVDLIGNSASSADNTGTSGDGLALISLWRWKRALGTGVNATAAPALLPGTAGARQVALGTDAAGANLVIIGADGAQARTANVFTGTPVGDVAVAASGDVFVVNGAQPGVLGIAPNSAAALNCSGSAPNATFGASPVMTTSGGKEAALVVTTAHSVAGANNFLTFTYDSVNGCSSAGALLVVPGGGDFTGAATGTGLLFASHAQGFSSYDLANTTSQVNSSVALLASAPPALLSGGANPTFATSDSTDHTLHETVKGTCNTVSTCWNDVTPPPAFVAASAALPYTPVFDATAAWAVDSQGKVYRWVRSSGTQPVALALGVAASAPVLLQDGSALVVQQDGGVTVISAAGSPHSLGNVGAFSKVPLVPVLDARPSGDGVAYVPNAGFLWAVETPTLPRAAGSSNWPRPGRDSCNSRNAGSLCP